MTSVEKVATAVPIWDDGRPHDDTLHLSSSVGRSARKEANDQSSLVGKIQYCSLAVGLFVGFFVESGALAAHVLYQGIQWKDQNPTPTQLVGFSLAWATATALLPCLALLFLRTILLLVSDAAMGIGRGSDAFGSAATRRAYMQYQDRLHDCLWHVESRFGLGSFFGVSLSATIMDLWMGVHRHLVLTAMLLFTVTLCFFFLSGGRKNIEDENFCDDNDLQEELLGDQYQHVVVQATFPKLEKKLDSVNPNDTHTVELKPGSLLIV